MNQRIIVRYSISFKHQVVEELESGRFSSISHARKHYGIAGADTIRNWLVRYGRNHLCAKVVRVEKPEEKNQIRHLKQQIKQLKEALGQTQAENVLHQEFLKIACEHLGQNLESFKKKVGTERFTKPPKERDQA